MESVLEKVLGSVHNQSLFFGLMANTIHMDFRSVKGSDIINI